MENLEREHYPYTYEEMVQNHNTAWYTNGVLNKKLPGVKCKLLELHRSPEEIQSMVTEFKLEETSSSDDKRIVHKRYSEKAENNTVIILDIMYFDDKMHVIEMILQDNFVKQ